LAKNFVCFAPIMGETDVSENFICFAAIIGETVVLPLIFNFEYK
jgi:hypothetical protein